MKKNIRRTVALLALFTTLAGCSKLSNPGYDG